MDLDQKLTEIILCESRGFIRRKEPISIGVPLPAGFVYDAKQLALFRKGHSRPLSLQAKPLGEWRDESLKWVLLDFQVSLNAGETVLLELFLKNSPPRCQMLVKETAGEIEVDTRELRIRLATKGEFRLHGASIGTRSILGTSGISCRLIGETNDNIFIPRIQAHEIICAGPVRTEIALNGCFESATGESSLDFESRLHLWEASGIARMDFSVTNPLPARHSGGLWDLGDPGSFLFRELSFHIHAPSDEDLTGQYRTQLEKGFRAFQTKDGMDLRIYQDSSGGRNWRSPNHVNRHGEIPFSFQGYRAFQGEEIVEEGPRASPFVAWNGANGSAGVGIYQFWQNFPKNLDMDADGIAVGLFPSCFGDLHELQAGERKTHTLFFLFSEADFLKDELAWIDSPLIPVIPSEWYEKSEAFPYFSASDLSPEPHLPKIFESAITGERSFFQKREEIDEYGWRNFGDIYADHESVNHKGPTPFISHYNNQYDCLYGMLFQFAKTGRTEWFRLADDLARHLADIDIYHTRLDRPEYNRGLFWHTDHYREAGTATHRAFTRKNSPPGGGYGGGPSLSHLYSTGFLYHHWMTGSPPSKESVLDLAHFAGENLEMENRVLNHLLRGLRRLKSKLKTRLTGGDLVQLVKVYELDGPGRASGNSLVALMNGYRLTGDFSFCELAENLIRRCVHPQDDLVRRDLGDVENRWMYTVFLQALGNYLDFAPRECSENSSWEYARSTLFHYADWMVKHEFLYLSRPEKLEYPNETWAVQELRKTNALLYACRYASDEMKKKQYLRKAESFFREGIRSFLSFRTHSFTRPVALLLQNSEMIQGFDSIFHHEKTPTYEKSLAKKTYPKFSLIRFLFRSFSLHKEINFLKWRLRN